MHGPSQATSGVQVALGAHRQTGTPTNETTGIGTEIHGTATATAGTARVIHTVGKGRPPHHVPRILTSLALVTRTMGESTERMMMPVPGTTVGKTGIGTATEIEIET